MLGDLADHATVKLTILAIKPAVMGISYCMALKKKSDVLDVTVAASICSVIILTLYSSTQRSFLHLHQHFAAPAPTGICIWYFSSFTQQEEPTASPTSSSQGTAVLSACCWVTCFIFMKLQQIPAWHSPAVQRTVRVRGKEGDLVHVWQPTVERERERELLTHWCFKSLLHPPCMYVVPRWSS